MKVLALTKYGSLAASTRHRFLQYAPALARRGLGVEVSPLLDDRYLERRYRTGRPSLGQALIGTVRRLHALRRASDAAVGWWAYELFPYAPALLESSLWPDEVPFVLDLDDATFHIYDQSPHEWVRRVLGPKLSRVGRRAAAVLAGSEYLVDYFDRAGARVHHIPTVVDTEHYVPRSEGAERRDFVVGWMGTPATARFLAAASGALERVQREIGARIRLVGAGGSAPPGIEAEVRPWSVDTEVREIQSFDVGIMPLPDSPFTRGKCAFKLVQYMACGIPVVASPIGANRALVERSGAGYLASTEGEWMEALIELYRDPAARSARGAAGRAHVEARYSLAVTAPRVAEILEACAGRSTS